MMERDALALWPEDEPDGLRASTTAAGVTALVEQPALDDQTILPDPAAGAHDHAELDNISPSLIVSSLTDLHANYLLNDLHSDYAVDECLSRVGGAVGTLALDYQPATQLQPHSHGLHPCSFASDQCPLNPFSEDPVFSNDSLLLTSPSPEAPVTLRAARVQKTVVTSSPDTPTRPVGRKPLRHIIKPLPVSAAAMSAVYRDPPPYPGLTRQERTDESQFYNALLERSPRLGICDRSIPRLKAVRRMQQSPALVRHHSDGSYSAVAPPAATAARRSLSASPARSPAATQTAGESRYTKPNLSYVNLITLSLLNSESGTLRCNEIYDFLMKVFPFFREVSTKTWKNDTRHALSSNQSSSNFCKAPESKDPSGAANRGALWMAKPEKVTFLHEHLQKTYYKFADNIKESMEHPELYGELLRGLPLYGESCLSPCDQSPTVGSTTDSPDESC